ncbi:MAG: transglycosylase SLT domain-containing protein [Myxococcota bacterium]
MKSVALIVALVASAVDGGAPPLEQARHWLRLGVPHKALETLQAAHLAEPRPDQPLHAGILGQAAAGAGEAALAQRALEPLRDHPQLPPLARLAVEARYLAVCTLPCSRRPIPDADVQAAPLPLQARLLTALARTDAPAALGLSRTLERSEPWKGATPGWQRAELLAAMHTAHTAAGDTSGARALAITAWETVPAEPAVSTILGALPDEVVAAEVGPARSVVHLEALLAANRNDDVVRFGELLCRTGVTTATAVCPALPDELRCQAGFAVGKAQRQSRRYAQAEQTLSVVAERCPTQAPRALFLQGRAMVAQKGGGKRAMAVLEQLAAKHPDSNLADDALVLAGETAARNGLRAAAHKYWGTVVEKYPQADLHMEAGWWLAWSTLEGGKTAQALTRLDAICKEADGKNKPLWRRATYWRARLTSEVKTARNRMTELVEKHPGSYEAALARGWLRRGGTPARSGADLPAAPPPLTPPAALDAVTASALALSSVGMDEDAALLLRGSALLTTGARTDGADLWVAQQMLAVGDAAGASQWVRRQRAAQLLGAPMAETAHVWQLAYPPAFAAAITSAAEAAGIPPALLFALAREESAFDPRITSWAGAVGLTQLMPSTALAEALSLKLQKPDHVALLDPALNARLGAAHLARHLRQFHGNVALALAAYNAGPGAVARWVERKGDAPLDMFVEQIPIEETRGYVKRVLESYSIYTLLRGATPLELPEKVSDRMLEL